ncbi:MAG: hypothetical protein GYB33_19355 [Gammaproteobacteria bacterium]|uniref:hypothetical protein n=1 Tax=Pseudomaricurvus alcaniphilus TaxID=1166482 RepID=UPI0014079DAA|nr:hypothetical protein [Pseudomaricurvus alcaniphilus]MBR9912503.1 hypothetical protein [Gammaproteobacteria bacterium]NHN36284.1 hypothetical protein [Pseudomaricurvus alcaniphilus]
MYQRPRFSSRPDVFSRGALELTFQLLRQANFGLALDIQNQLQGTKLPELAAEELTARNSREHFRITLNAQTIGRIVDALTRLGEQCLRNKAQEQDQLQVLRTLIKDWMALAEWHISRAEPPSDTVH